jgi:hypothetical protein
MTFRAAVLVLNPSPTAVCAGQRSFRAEEIRSAACALQDFSLGEIHGRPPG